MIARIVQKIIFYPWGALWYVLATIVALNIVVYFYKNNKMKDAIMIGAFLYLFALVCNNYYFIVEGTVFQKIVDIYLKVCISGRNGVFEGLYFIASGIYIAQRKVQGKNFSTGKHDFILIVSYVMLLAEILFIKNCTHKDDHSLFIMFLVLIPEFLIFASRFKSNYNTKLLRNYSTGIYFMHSHIKFYESLILSTIGITIDNFTLFISVVLIALIVVTILYKVNNKYINMVTK